MSLFKIEFGPLFSLDNFELQMTKQNLYFFKDHHPQSYQEITCMHFILPQKVAN